MWKLSPAAGLSNTGKEWVKVAVLQPKAGCGVGVGPGCPVGQRVRIQLMVHIFFLINILCFKKGFKDFEKEILAKCHLITI